MSATRRFVKEALEITVSDSIGTHDIPDSRAPGEEERFVDLDIDTQVNTINTLVDKLGSYHELLNDFPAGSVLTPSEERLFKAAVNMSFAGEGITADDIRIVAESDGRFTVSTEGVGSVLMGIGKAIADAIRALIEKVKAFFRWITGNKTREEKEAEQIRKALDSLPGGIEAALEKSIQELEKGIQDFHKSIDDEHREADRLIKTLSQGTVLEGKTLVVTTKTTANPNGKTVRVDVGKMIDLPWDRINYLFSEPPSNHRIDLMVAANAINSVIDHTATTVPELLKLYGKLDSNIDRLIKGKQTKESIMVSDMRSLADQLKNLRHAIMHAYPFEAHQHNDGVLVSKPYAPSGATLTIHPSHASIGQGTPWNDFFTGECAPYTFRTAAKLPSRHDGKFSIQVASPSTLAAAIDGCMKRYFNAFHRVKEITDEMKLIDKTFEFDTAWTDAQKELDILKSAPPIQGDDDISARRRLQNNYYRDLLSLKSITVHSYGTCYQLLTTITAMLSQYKKLYNWLPK